MPKIIVCGEAWGSNEARTRTPLVGASGIELLRMLGDAEVISLSAADRDYMRNFYQTGDSAQIEMIWQLHPEVYRTNVFNFHPVGNDLKPLCTTAKLGIAGWPALIQSGYLKPEYLPELIRLDEEVRALAPNLIIALGNTPLWAFCGVTKVSKLRGTTREATHLAAGTKVLPVYHPAAVLRDWSLRPLTVMDLEKANREKEFPDVRRPHREIWIEPTIQDIERFKARHIDGCTLLSVDIETSGTRITCIGFAPAKDIALVIPFDDPRAKTNSFWATKQDDLLAWKAVKGILEDRTILKVFQNGLYDIAFLWRSMGIRTYGAREDTMLLHHALQPESQKGLGFLGSLYTDEGAWKSDRPLKEKFKTLKKDD